MLKVCKDDIEIKGDFVGISIELSNLIMKLKDVIRCSEGNLQLFDLLLLECFASEDMQDFLENEDTDFEKIKNKIEKIEAEAETSTRM